MAILWQYTIGSSCQLTPNSVFYIIEASITPSPAKRQLMALSATLRGEELKHPEIMISLILCMCNPRTFQNMNFVDMYAIELC